MSSYIGNVALLRSGLALLLMGCSATAPPDDPEPEPDPDPLKVGTLLPVSGNLAFLGPALVSGVRLAVEDINAAGGVFGQDVSLVEDDSGRVQLATERLLEAGVHAIIGAASSAKSLDVIDEITGAGVIQFSPANTSPQFTHYADNGLYFRTAPSDVLQGRVIADQIWEDGDRSVALLYLDDAYGLGLAEAIEERFLGLGGTVPHSVAHGFATPVEDSQIDTLVSVNPDAIVVIGFDESGVLVEALHDAGVGPTSKHVWGVDGYIGALGSIVDDPAIIAGMRGTEPRIDPERLAPLTARLEVAYGGDIPVAFYHGEAYDAVVITALAAQVASSDVPGEVAAEINDVTRTGVLCESYADCLASIESGNDIDYDGYGGPYEFIDAGEPSVASYAVLTYSGGSQPDSSVDYVFSAL